VSRVQLALNVADIDVAIDFYSKLFATEPAKVRPGYANFAIADPRSSLSSSRMPRRHRARSITSGSRSRAPSRYLEPRSGSLPRGWPRRPKAT